MTHQVRDLSIYAAPNLMTSLLIKFNSVKIRLIRIIRVLV